MKKIINTKEAPAAIGPYSQAIEANGMIFLSGQIALDPDNGELKNDNIQQETRQVLDNLTSVLKAAGSKLSLVVKCSIFMSEMAHYTTVNEIYAEYFKDDAPAREAMAVKELPKGVNVEISAIALSA